MKTQKVTALRHEPPSVLFRRFGKKEHAEEFAAGSIRMRNLSYYRGIGDDTRKDALEGITLIDSKDKPITIRDNEGKELFSGHCTDHWKLRVTQPENYFISSFSTVCAAEHRNWGPWIVQVNNPAKIFEELAAEIPKGMELIWANVLYADMPAGKDLLEHRASWYTKRKAYASEHEFRLALWVRQGSDYNEETIFTLDFSPDAGELEIFQDG